MHAWQFVPTSLQYVDAPEIIAVQMRRKGSWTTLIAHWCPNSLRECDESTRISNRELSPWMLDKVIFRNITSSHTNLPRFPTPPNPSLPWPKFEISNNSAKFIFRFCPAALESELVDLAFSRVGWLVCLAFVLEVLVKASGATGACGIVEPSWLWLRALSDRSRSERVISASWGYCCDDRKVNAPCCGGTFIASLRLTVVGGTWGSVRAGDDVRAVAVVGDNLVALWDRRTSGDDPRSNFSPASSSLSRFCENASRPSNLSVAQRRIFHPSPSLSPISSLSKYANSSSNASW